MALSQEEKWFEKTEINFFWTYRIHFCQFFESKNSLKNQTQLLTFSNRIAKKWLQKMFEFIIGNLIKFQILTPNSNKPVSFLLSNATGDWTCFPLVPRRPMCALFHITSLNTLNFFEEELFADSLAHFLNYKKNKSKLCWRGLLDTAS